MTTQEERHTKRRKAILETFRKIGTISGTAKRLRTSRRAIRRVLRGQDAPQRPKPPASPPPRPSKLDPYKAVIRGLVLEDGFTGPLVLDEVRGRGYSGGYSILKEYIRTIRPAPKIAATIRLTHEPGSPAQVDWSPHPVTLGGDARIAHCFSLVLPFSRYMVVRYALDETVETLIAMHDEAFEDLQGVPAVITYDNMTTVGRHVGPDEVQINPTFELYAKRCGFEIVLIDPGRPNQHASVERPFGYVESNCLKRRRSNFASLDDLNEHTRGWCDNVANVRVHRTTRERPVDRLARERAFLKPLPGQQPEPFREISRQVGADFCVAVDTNQYSVPPRYAGMPATIRLYEHRLEIRVGGELVAEHPRHDTRHGRHLLPEHEAEFKRWSPSRRLLEQAFLRLGQDAKDYYEGLVAQRGRGAGYHLQRILKMADRHGSTVVTAAMSHASRYGNYSAEAVARVIAGRRMPRIRNGENREPSVPPETVRRWLEGLDVESGDLAHYDDLINGAGDDQEADDGQG